MQHALLIVNPHSRNGQAEALQDAIELLKNAGIDVSINESESAEHLVSLIEEYDREDGIVIVAGGDGTISSALEVIYNCQRTLAIFPMGTANDLAKSIGVPADLLSAAQVIAEGKRESISLGKVNGHYFINVAHVGLGVDVTREITPESKKYFGVFAYLTAFFRALKRNKSFKVKITHDDGYCSSKAIHLAIGNGRFYGGGNIVDERASLLDDELSLFFIKPQPWWKLILLGPILRTGAKHNTDRIVRKSAKKFSIQTTRPKSLEADGEFKTKTPAEFEVIPEAIKVIVGEPPIPTSGTQ